MGSPGCSMAPEDSSEGRVDSGILLPSKSAPPIRHPRIEEGDGRMNAGFLEAVQR